jgi:hypothetical protein
MFEDKRTIRQIKRKWKLQEENKRKTVEVKAKRVHEKLYPGIARGGNYNFLREIWREMSFSDQNDIAGK